MYPCSLTQYIYSFFCFLCMLSMHLCKAGVFFFSLNYLLGLSFMWIAAIRPLSLYQYCHETKMGKKWSRKHLKDVCLTFWFSFICSVGCILSQLLCSVKKKLKQEVLLDQCCLHLVKWSIQKATKISCFD